MESPNNSFQQYLNLAQKAAFGAAEIIKKYRKENNFSVTTKSSASDLVTTADIASEEFITSLIKENYPDHQIFGEESFKEGQEFDFSKPMWVIDPIDGTSNYAFGLPLVAISIAYLEDFEVKAGVVYCPFIDELYLAIKGCGAFLNGEKIAVNELREIDQSIMVATLSNSAKTDDTKVKETMDVFTKVYKKAMDIRRSCVASLELCWLAKGSISGYHCRILMPWDIAAANLIISEAGGVTGCYDLDNLILKELEHFSSNQSESSPSNISKRKLLYSDNLKMFLPKDLFCEFYFACSRKIEKEYLELLK